MIETKEQMWAFILNRNPEIREATQISLPTKQLERMVHVVWQQAELNANRRNPVDVLGQMFGGGR
jgi:hypothetical protein